MKNELEIGNVSMPSVLKNPFIKNCVTDIRVSYGKSMFSDDWSANGKVCFENGQTKGEQKFKAKTFDEVVIQIKHFLKELEK
jgi:hypothetical protein